MKEGHVLLLAGVGAGHVLSLQVREEGDVLLPAGVGSGHVLSKGEWKCTPSEGGRDRTCTHAVFR